MADWDNRLSFESYLYDYLIKRNMHEAAEIFRNETNLSLDAMIPPRKYGLIFSETDVPEGFLLEWWSVCYDFDFFREWLQLHVGCTAGKAPITMDLIVAQFKLVYQCNNVYKSHSSWVSLQENQRLEATQGWNASEAEQCPMNAEAENQLPNNFSLTLSGESNSMASHASGEVPLLYLPSSHQEACGELAELYLPFSHQEVGGELPQLFLPSSHREELLTSTLRTVNVANTSGQNVESLVQNASKAENTAFNEDTDPVIENLLNSFWLFEQDQMELFDKPTLGESSRHMKNLLACGEGCTGMNEFTGFTSPALWDDDNKSENSDCSSNFRIVSTAADASLGNC